MGKSSIHIQKASGGAITHNSRENYSKSVVFTDEKNELWNDKKQAYEIYRSEINKRIEAYSNRTNQKLQKTAVTQLSAVVNLEQHHTLKNLEKIKEELEKVFDTKVYQMAIHRDEGKLKHKVTGEYLVSGTDFFYNPNDEKYYTKKRVEDKKHIFENELNIFEYEIEKNYHAHIEMLGLDSQGQAIRQKMNRFVLSQLQDFTALTLNMERGNLFTNNQSKKRLDTHEFKASKKQENEVKKVVKKEKNKIITKANEIIKDERSQKKILKEELEKLNEENKSLRAELQIYKSERTVYAELEALNKKLKSDLETGRKNFDLVKQELETFKDKYLKTKSELNLVECKAIDLKEELEEIKLEVYHPKYKTESGNQVTNKIVANFFEKELNKKDLEIVELKKENKSLQEQKKVLEYKVTVLQEKSSHSSNMSDYEELKKENESLKKENRSLKEKIKNIISQANEKIKELFRFKIFANTALANDDLNWKKECDDDIRLEVRYKRGIESELIQYQEEAKEKDYFKSKLDDMVTNTKNMKTELEKSTQLLKKMFPEKEKKKEEEYHHHRDNFHHR